MLGRLFSNLKFDLPAGIIVALVALPLALGFGVTAGAGVASGLVTAIIAGFVAGIFGGSNYQVSGPTGAMVVVLYPIVQNVGVAGLFAVGILAGMLIALFGLFKLGNYAEKIPWSVMEGFTLGIAIVIALQQLPLVLGVNRSKETETIIAAWGTIQKATMEQVNFWSLALVALTIAVKISWNFLKGKFEKLAMVPASAVAVLLVSIFSFLASAPVPKVGQLPGSEIFALTFNWPQLELGVLIYSAVLVALLGAIESLLSARVADSMVHRRDSSLPEKFQPNRELVGQGLATIASSLFGGMPATGAIARTAVNVNSGAKTRAATVIHALVLLLFVLALGSVVAEIPLPVLAGVLLGASWRIANPTSIRENLRTAWFDRVAFLATAVAVVAIDLIWGIALGVAIRWLLLKFADQNGSYQPAN